MNRLNRILARLKTSRNQPRVGASSAAPKDRSLVPGWAVQLCFPTSDAPMTQSWLGGVPNLPPGMDWPRGNGDVALSFVGQFDLADIKPEPITGERPPGLPEEGALLIFLTPDYDFDDNGYTILLSAEEAAAAKPAAVPPDLVNLRTLGFRLDNPTFPRWSVTLEPFLEQDPRFIAGPSRDDDPSPYIRTWADAAVLARAALEEVTRRLDGLDQSEQWAYERLLADDIEPAQAEKDRARLRWITRMRSECPAALARLTDWLARVEKENPAGPIDRDAFDAHMEWQSGIDMPSHSISHFLLVLCVKHRVQDSKTWLFDWTRVSPEHHACLAALARRWSGHVLFGPHMPYLVDDDPDFAMKDRVFTIRMDPLLQFELCGGVTGWRDRTDIAAARYGPCWLVWLGQDLGG